MKLENKRMVMLAEEGCEVVIAGSGSKEKYNGKHGLSVEIDTDCEKIFSRNFDRIIVPGGWAPDKLRRYPEILKLVKDFADEDKLLAAICHGGWVFVSAKVLKGYKMTCVNAIIDDVCNAGAEYIDEEVVVDRNLITSRTPVDLPAYMSTIIDYLS